MSARDLELLKSDCADMVVLLDRFPAIVEKFVQLTGRTETGFGKETNYGVDFVRLVKGGRDFRASTLRKVAELIAKEPYRRE